MTDIIAKNLLLNHTCDTCGQFQGEYTKEVKALVPRMCLYWLGTTQGWQWRDLPEEMTCEAWKDKK